MRARSSQPSDRTDPTVSLAANALPANLPADVRDCAQSALIIAILEHRGVLPGAAVIKRITREAWRETRGDRFTPSLDDWSFDEPKTSQRIDQLTAEDVQARFERAAIYKRNCRRIRTPPSPCTRCHSRDVQRAGFNWHTGWPSTRCKTCRRVFDDQVRALEEPVESMRGVRSSASPCTRCASRRTTGDGYSSSGSPRSYCRECGRTFIDRATTRPRRAPQPQVRKKPCQRAKSAPCPGCGSGRTKGAGYAPNSTPLSKCKRCDRTFRDAAAGPSAPPRPHKNTPPLYQLWNRVRKGDCCTAWRESFAAFRDAIGERPAQHVLRRPDHSRPLGSDNFEWDGGPQRLQRPALRKKEPTPRQLSSIRTRGARLLASLRHAGLNDAAGEVQVVLGRIGALES